MSGRQARCRGCGQAITWAETERGKRMPFDAQPSEEGTFVLMNPSVFYGRPAEDGTPIAVFHTKAESVRTIRRNDDRERFTPHHATCPEKDRYGW